MQVNRALHGIEKSRVIYIYIYIAEPTGSLRGVTTGKKTAITAV